MLSKTLHFLFDDSDTWLPTLEMKKILGINCFAENNKARRIIVMNDLRCSSVSTDMEDSFSTVSWRLEDLWNLQSCKQMLLHSCRTSYNIMKKLLLESVGCYLSYMALWMRVLVIFFGPLNPVGSRSITALKIIFFCLIYTLSVTVFLFCPTLFALLICFLVIFHT